MVRLLCAAASIDGNRGSNAIAAPLGPCDHAHALQDAAPRALSACQMTAALPACRYKSWLPKSQFNHESSKERQR